MKFVVHTRPKALPDEPTGLYKPGEDTALKYFKTKLEARDYCYFIRKLSSVNARDFWVNYSEVLE